MRAVSKCSKGLIHFQDISGEISEKEGGSCHKWQVIFAVEIKKSPLDDGQRITEYTRKLGVCSGFSGKEGPLHTR